MFKTILIIILTALIGLLSIVIIRKKLKCPKCGSRLSVKGLTSDDGRHKEFFYCLNCDKDKSFFNT